MAQVDILTGQYKGQTAIVVGTAPCVTDEFAEAIDRRPDAVIISVNDASAIVYADFVSTLHPERMLAFKGKSLNKNAITISGQYMDDKRHKGVDHWFSGAHSGATSSYSAVQMARAMGFSEIIMCGCPMNGGDGYHKLADWDGGMMQMGTRFGHGDAKRRAVRLNQDRLVLCSQQEDCSMVRSMSGFTAEIFGQPEWREENDNN